MKSARLAVLLAAFAFGCGGDPPADAVYVRVQNDTDVDFTALLLAFAVEIGPLGAGQTYGVGLTPPSTIGGNDGLVFFGLP